MAETQKLYENFSGSIDQIQNADHIIIEQHPDWIECIPCLEAKNKYDIFSCDADFEDTKEQIGTVNEIQDSCCCLFGCKCFRSYKNELVIGGQTFAESERPYRIPICSCLACLKPCKPELSVTYNKEPIGIINWPCWHPCFPSRKCFSCMEFDVILPNGNQLYTITSPCLQTGWCFWGCGCIKSCSRREYIIQDSTKAQVGKIVNIYNGCCYEVLSRADKFGIQFPKNIPLEYKLLLIKATVFLDYLQYMA